MSDIKIVTADIATMDTDCVVNAANKGLHEGGGVCGDIFKAAGAGELTEACEKIGGCPTGHAVITPGFALKAKYIIHAVGPRWNDAGKDRELLAGCYKESLERARENDCHSIAFPVISSGIFGYPKDVAWEQAIKGCSEWIKDNPDYDMEIVFTVRSESSKELGESILEASAS